MLRKTFDAVRSLAPELRVLFLTTLLFRAGTMAFPFLTAYLIGRGHYSDTQIGVIVAAYGVGALVADVVAGPLLRALPARTAMLAGLLGNAVTVLVLPAAHGAAMLTLGTFVWGFCYETFTPASYAETIRHSTDEQRKIAFSCNRLAINLGMGLGPAVGGLIFAWKPVGLFGLNAVIVLAAALFLGSRMRSRQQPSQAGARGRTGLVAETVRGETRFWSIFTLAIPIHLAYALPPTFLSAYVIHERGLASAWAGTIFLVNALCIVLFELPLNTSMRNVSHFTSLMIGYLLAGAGFALMGAASNGPALAGATLCWTAAEMIVFPALLHYVSAVSDTTVTGRNMGLYSAGVNIGLIAAPQLSLILVARHGPATPWLWAGALVGLCLLLIVAVRRSSYLWLTDDLPMPTPAATKG